MAAIVLTTINARYIHASLGLRRVYANLGELRAQARIEEFCSQHGDEYWTPAPLLVERAKAGKGFYA